MAERANISLTVGGVAVGTLVAASLLVELEFLEAAPEEVYGWDDLLPGATSWNAEASLLVPLRGADDALVALKQAQVERTAIACVVNYQAGGSIETGTAIVSKLSLEAGIGDVLRGSISLLGTGTLTES